MGSLPRLNGFDKAEDLFEFLGVVYHRRVLAANRSRIMRQFSLELEEMERRVPDPDDDEALELCREALRRAYDAFHVPLAPTDEERLFGTFGANALRFAFGEPGV